MALASSASMLNCPLCNGKFASSTDCVRLPACKHVFHKCVNNWLKAKSTCPLCLKAAEPETTEQVQLSAEEAELALKPAAAGGGASSQHQVPFAKETIDQHMKTLEMDKKEKVAVLKQLQSGNNPNLQRYYQLKRMNEDLDYNYHLDSDTREDLKSDLQHEMNMSMIDAQFEADMRVIDAEHEAAMLRIEAEDYSEEY